MILIELKFPLGRIHATPWGRHVNEGAVEWPPSPWRFLRSLIATWHLKAKNEISFDILQSLITALASEMPSFQLPAASLGHTRHYMPYIEGTNEKTTKIFDAFIHVSKNDSLLMGWNNLNLSPNEEQALALLVGRLGYLGRAESLVEAQVLPSPTDWNPNAEPLADHLTLPSEREVVRILAPMNPSAYVEWRTQLLAELTPPKPAKGKLSKKDLPPPVPESLFEALNADTSDLQSEGWSLPPGAVQAVYCRPEQPFLNPSVQITSRNKKTITVARFAIASQVLPRILQSLSVAERIHQTLTTISSDSIYTGIDANGMPLKDHRHTHIWCEALGDRDQITHVTIFAPGGFQDAGMALRKLGNREVWGHGGHNLQLILLNLGNPEDFPESPVFKTSKVWKSYTPFVPTRHPKEFRDGRPKLDADGWHIGSAKHDVRRLLGDRMKLLSKIEEIRCSPVRDLAWLKFGTQRYHGGGVRTVVNPTGFQLTFKEPVQGPINLGYGCHFGLGLFVPA